MNTSTIHLTGFSSILLSSLTLYVSCLQMGCTADKGPRKHDVTGKVVYAGEPLQVGRITFVPDHDRGNSGPPGYAMIRDGFFDTKAMGGKASISGPIKVLITGFDMSAGENGEAKEPLFEGYTIPAEINPEQRHTSFDFEVPLVEKKGSRKKKS